MRRTDSRTGPSTGGATASRDRPSWTREIEDRVGLDPRGGPDDVFPRDGVHARDDLVGGHGLPVQAHLQEGPDLRGRVVLAGADAVRDGQPRLAPLVLA